VEGYHYDSEGNLQFNTAIMRFDVTEPDNPQQLLLVDFGESIGAPTWSPDGRYILYDLSISDTEAETWWLEVATGKTGRLTANIISVDWSESTPITPTPSEQIYLPAMVK
jgi:Tol biopolymer transport system component